jgi:hypothetical protein
MTPLAPARNRHSAIDRNLIVFAALLAARHAEPKMKPPRHAPIAVDLMSSISGVVGIDNQDREETSQVGRARVFADIVICAGRLGLAFARIVDLHFAVGYLASDRSGEHRLRTPSVRDVSRC